MMTPLIFGKERTDPIEVLCLGAHSDDIEIGSGGTILSLAAQYPQVRFHWVVFSACGIREAEARRAAESFAGGHLQSIRVKTFKDGFLPYVGAEVKSVFEDELKGIKPEVILTHNRRDAHQDHRIISDLTWNTFRDQLILEYEIPKYDGDLGQPNVFMPLQEQTAQRKASLILDAFASQRGKAWFEERTFLAMMRVRGMECNAASGYAEAFYGRKLVLGRT